MGLTYKILELPIWRGDGDQYEFSLCVENYMMTEACIEIGRLDVVPCRIETEADLFEWVRRHNAFFSRWVNGHEGYVPRRPDQPHVHLILPLGIRRQVYHSVVIQTPEDKKHWDGFPCGRFVYPKARTSQTECEAIIERLKTHLEALTLAPS